jgi:hypothetical protein
MNNQGHLFFFSSLFILDLYVKTMSTESDSVKEKIFPLFTELRIYPSFTEIREKFNAPQVLQ